MRQVNLFMPCGKHFSRSPSESLREPDNLQLLVRCPCGRVSKPAQFRAMAGPFSRLFEVESTGVMSADSDSESMGRR